MQNNKLFWFRALSWYVGVYHSILGIIGILAPGQFVISLASKIYSLGGSAFSPQFIVTARFASAYMLALGVMAILMGMKPFKYRGLIIPIIIMIIARIYTRVIYATDISAAFGSDPSGNIRVIAIITVIGLGLLLLQPKNDK